MTIAYSEEGALLDKLCITNDTMLTSGMGMPADLFCVQDTTTPSVGINSITNEADRYVLDQNVPNPFTGTTSIMFGIPDDTYVSIKVYTLIGEEIAELAGKEYVAGRHNIEFDARGLAKGIYFYTLNTYNYSVSRKMIVHNEN
jgi:hypothetical protein